VSSLFHSKINILMTPFEKEKDELGFNQHSKNSIMKTTMWKKHSWVLKSHLKVWFWHFKELNIGVIIEFGMKNYDLFASPDLLSD
jgi:hypothetical protein